MRTRVKICGVTGVEDARLAVEAGADAIGLNFYPKSPRYVSEDVAASILAELPALVEPVGLFVNQPWDDIRGCMDRLGLRMCQLHANAIQPVNTTPLRYLPAFAVRDESSLVTINAYLDHARRANAMPSGIVVDGYAPGLHGGTGQRAPWELLAAYRPGVPMILAGGLTADNVADAVRAVRPYAVDVASGVESVPGRKDPGKVRDFIEAVRSAE